MSKICPYCGKTHEAANICPYCGAEVPPDIESQIQEYKQNQEYRRTCRNCGKIWHSLVSRENKLSFRATTTKIGVCGSQMQSASCCFMCGGSKTAQLERNVDAVGSELNRLKSCPECGSKNYSEDLMTYDR